MRNIHAHPIVQSGLARQNTEASPLLGHLPFPRGSPLMTSSAPVMNSGGLPSGNAICSVARVEVSVGRDPGNIRTSRIGNACSGIPILRSSSHFLHADAVQHLRSTGDRLLPGDPGTEQVWRVTQRKEAERSDPEKRCGEQQTFPCSNGQGSADAYRGGEDDERVDQRGRSIR